MQQDRYCRNCGQELQPEDRFCANCGRPVQETAAVPTPEADVPVPLPPQAEDRSVPTQAQQPRPDLVAEERERLAALREARRRNFWARRARSMTLLSLLVRETGLANDAEREALLEASKLKVEAAKTQVLISSGSLVGIAAVVKVLPTGQHQFFMLGAFYFICLSVIGGYVWMEDISRAVTALRRPPREISWFGPLLLALGLFVFGLYLFYNVSWEHAEGIRACAEARIVVWTLNAGVVLLGIIAFTAVVLLWRRIEEAPQEDSEAGPWWWVFWQ